tara:strand:- start:1326 stop:1811 length:486 start_codon:yes stop_codon:yes gene_type:complete
MLTGIQSGALGEAIVTARLLRLGCTVLTPTTPEPYDIMVTLNGRCVRVQVKSAGKPFAHRNQLRYGFLVSCGAGKRMYKIGEVDMFVLIALDTEKCWVIPAKHLSQKSVKIPTKTSGKWSKYLEAWQLLEQYSVSHETCRSRSALSPSSDSTTGSNAGENY